MTVPALLYSLIKENAIGVLLQSCNKSLSCEYRKPAKSLVCS